MKKIFITGASGFVGGYLAEHLLSLGNGEIYGTYLTEESLQTSPVKDQIHFHQLDLEDTEKLQSLIKEISPDEVYHLAALASVGMSFKDPLKVLHANIDAEINMFEALRVLGLTHTRVLITSSAEVYGYVHPEDLPIDENTPLRPANPYSVSKIAQDFLGYQYSVSYNMSILRVRPFNHIGPRQLPGFVIADFAKQIAEIEKGIQSPVIKVGNLEAKRDFTDVRDMVRAYALLMEKGQGGEVYNIGSGTSRKIADILDQMIALSAKTITKETDPTKLRPSDVPEIVADAQKFQELTGWKPEIAFEKTIQDTLDYWRTIV